MTNELLQKAMDMDVQAEIEKRFEVARKAIEDSQNLESARSGLSVSQSAGVKGTGKRRVQFDKSVKGRLSSSGDKWHHSSVQQLDDDSIRESIQIAESISNSIRSQSAAGIGQSKSKNSLATSG